MTGIEAIRRTLDLLKTSKDSSWTSNTVEEIRRELSLAAVALEEGRSFNREKLSLLYGPTGPIQETAIDNGWGDELLMLAAAVERQLS